MAQDFTRSALAALNQKCKQRGPKHPWSYPGLYSEEDQVHGQGIAAQRQDRDAIEDSRNQKADSVAIEECVKS